MARPSSDAGATVGWLDCSSGCSGDMLLGALLDVGVPLDVVRGAVAAVAPEEVEISTEPVYRSGFAALQARVEAAPSLVHRDWADIRALIDESRLRRMKPTAVLVNVSRGTVVDEAALVRALRERRIAAAGLDVYEREPRVSPELLTMENVVLLPHIGSASAATRERMALVAAENVAAALDGRPPPDRVV